MRPHCIFIACLVLFGFCSLARSQISYGLDKCCFTFSNVRIPVQQVVSFHSTHLECHRSGIIFATKDRGEICADPMVKWVQRLQTSLDTRILKSTVAETSSGEKPLTLRKTESIRTSETAPLERPEETTLVQLIETSDWLDFDTTQANPNTESAYFCMQPEGE